MHEGYSCEQFDVKYHAGLDKLWKATGLTSSDDIFEDAARMIREYIKLTSSESVV
jgi:hypothetical protein